MALTQTTLDRVVAKYGQLDRNEVRPGSYGFLDLGKQNKGLLIESEVASKKRSLSQNVVVPVLNKGHVGTSGGRVIGNIPTHLGTSAMVTLTTQTFQREFSLQPAENFTNQISYEKELARVIEEVQLLMMADIDAYALTQVNAVRSQADNSGAYPISADAFQVPNTDYQKVMSMIDAIYNANKFVGSSINVIANPMYAYVISEIMEHGSNNDQNKIIRIFGKNIRYSNAIVPASTHTHELFVSPIAGFEILNFNEPDAVLKTKVSEAEYKGLITLPLLGMTCGLYTQNKYVANASGTASTKMETYEIATDVSVVTPYSSSPATTPAANTKFDLLT